MSKQSYKELAIPYFKETFDIVDRIMRAHKIPYYLIGASAIALKLLNHNIKPSRGTKDIDFAIMISSIAVYEEISENLIAEGYNKVKAPWTFYSQKYNVVIDVLPYGKIEENHTVDFTERRTDLHVLGFKEVLEEATPLPIEEKIVNVPPLPGMIILKLIAWSDRPEEREHDLTDILQIIQYYFEIAFDEIVEFHNDIFPENNFDQMVIAAEVLGRKVKLILFKSKELSDRILKILEINLSDTSISKITKTWAIKLDRDIEYASSILRAFQNGINGE